MCATEKDRFIYYIFTLNTLGMENEGLFWIELLYYITHSGCQRIGLLCPKSSIPQLVLYAEPEFVNFSGAQESIPRSQFRQAV